MPDPASEALGGPGSPPDQPTVNQQVTGTASGEPALQACDITTPVQDENHTPAAGVDLKTALDLLVGKHDSFEFRVREAPCTQLADFPRVRAKFYYLSFRDGLPSQSEFVNYLKHQMVQYCIPLRDRMRTWAKIQASPEDRYRLMADEIDKARGLFIKARKLQTKAGEPGELILFVLLEWAMKAPQLVSKMYLKTNAQMPVYGSDGIHVGLDTDGVSLRLYLGESKLYDNVPDALTAVFKSITTFVQDKGMQAREIQVARDHMTLGDEHAMLKDALLRYLDPYEQQQVQRRDVFACFVGFDFMKYKDLQKLSPELVESEFKKLFDARVQEVMELLKGRLGGVGMDVINFEFFLLPFPSVANFRTAFFDATGIPCDAD